MQIFAVDRDPAQAARMLCDKHVVKMPTESAQLISAALAVLGVDHPYRAPLSRQRNKLTQWILSSASNFLWLVQHAHALCAEYTWRYSRVHKAKDALYFSSASEIFSRVQDIGITPFVQNFDSDLHSEDPVEGYRNLYRYKILIIDMRWTRREKPEWV